MRLFLEVPHVIAQAADSSIDCNDPSVCWQVCFGAPACEGDVAALAVPLASGGPPFFRLTDDLVCPVVAANDTSYTGDVEVGLRYGFGGVAAAKRSPAAAASDGARAKDTRLFAFELPEPAGDAHALASGGEGAAPRSLLLRVRLLAGFRVVRETIVPLSLLPPLAEGAVVAAASEATPSGPVPLRLWQTSRVPVSLRRPWQPVTLGGLTAASQMLGQGVPDALVAAAASDAHAARALAVAAEEAALEAASFQPVEVMADFGVTWWPDDSADGGSWHAASVAGSAAAGAASPGIEPGPGTLALTAGAAGGDAPASLPPSGPASGSSFTSSSLAAVGTPIPDLVPRSAAAAGSPNQGDDAEAPPSGPVVYVDVSSLVTLAAPAAAAAAGPSIPPLAPRLEHVTLAVALSRGSAALVCPPQLVGMAATATTPGGGAAAHWVTEAPHTVRIALPSLLPPAAGASSSAAAASLLDADLHLLFYLLAAPDARTPQGYMVQTHAPSSPLEYPWVSPPPPDPANPSAPAAPAVVAFAYLRLQDMEGRPLGARHHAPPGTPGAAAPSLAAGGAVVHAPRPGLTVVHSQYPGRASALARLRVYAGSPPFLPASDGADGGILGRPLFAPSPVAVTIGPDVLVPVPPAGEEAAPAPPLPAPPHLRLLAPTPASGAAASSSGTAALSAAIGVEAGTGKPWVNDVRLGQRLGFFPAGLDVRVTVVAGGEGGAVLGHSLSRTRDVSQATAAPFFSTLVGLAGMTPPAAGAAAMAHTLLAEHAVALAARAGMRSTAAALAAAVDGARAAALAAPATPSLPPVGGLLAASARPGADLLTGGADGATQQPASSNAAAQPAALSPLALSDVLDVAASHRPLLLSLLRGFLALAPEAALTTAPPAAGAHASIVASDFTVLGLPPTAVTALADAALASSVRLGYPGSACPLPSPKAGPVRDAALLLASIGETLRVLAGCTTPGTRPVPGSIRAHPFARAVDRTLWGSMTATRAAGGADGGAAEYRAGILPPGPFSTLLEVAAAVVADSAGRLSSSARLTLRPAEALLASPAAPLQAAEAGVEWALAWLAALLLALRHVAHSGELLGVWVCHPLSLPPPELAGDYEEGSDGTDAGVAKPVAAAIGAPASPLALEPGVHLRRHAAAALAGVASLAAGLQASLAALRATPGPEAASGAAAAAAALARLSGGVAKLLPGLLHCAIRTGALPVKAAGRLASHLTAAVAGLPLPGAPAAPAVAPLAVPTTPATQAATPASAAPTPAAGRGVVAVDSLAGHASASAVIAKYRGVGAGGAGAATAGGAAATLRTPASGAVRPPPTPGFPAPTPAASSKAVAAPAAPTAAFALAPALLEVAPAAPWAAPSSGAVPADPLRSAASTTLWAARAAALQGSAVLALASGYVGRPGAASPLVPGAALQEAVTAFATLVGVGLSAHAAALALPSSEASDAAATAAVTGSLLPTLASVTRTLFGLGPGAEAAAGVTGAGAGPRASGAAGLRAALLYPLLGPLATWSALVWARLGALVVGGKAGASPASGPTLLPHARGASLLAAAMASETLALLRALAAAGSLNAGAPLRALPEAPFFESLLSSASVAACLVCPTYAPHARAALTAEAADAAAAAAGDAALALPSLLHPFPCPAGLKEAILAALAGSAAAARKMLGPGRSRPLTLAPLHAGASTAASRQAALVAACSGAPEGAVAGGRRASIASAVSQTASSSSWAVDGKGPGELLADLDDVTVRAVWSGHVGLACRDVVDGFVPYALAAADAAALAGWGAAAGVPPPPPPAAATPVAAAADTLVGLAASALGGLAPASEAPASSSQAWVLAPGAPPSAAAAASLPDALAALHRLGHVIRCVAAAAAGAPLGPALARWGLLPGLWRVYASLAGRSIERAVAQLCKAVASQLGVPASSKASALASAAVGITAVSGFLRDAVNVSLDTAAACAGDLSSLALAGSLARAAGGHGRLAAATVKASGATGGVDPVVVLDAMVDAVARITRAAVAGERRLVRIAGRDGYPHLAGRTLPLDDAAASAEPSADAAASSSAAVWRLFSRVLASLVAALEASLPRPSPAAKGAPTAVPRADPVKSLAAFALVADVFWRATAPSALKAGGAASRGAGRHPLLVSLRDTVRRLRPDAARWALLLQQAAVASGGSARGVASAASFRGVAPPLHTHLRRLATASLACGDADASAGLYALLARLHGWPGPGPATAPPLPPPGAAPVSDDGSLVPMPSDAADVLGDDVDWLCTAHALAARAAIAVSGLQAGLGPAAEAAPGTVAFPSTACLLPLLTKTEGALADAFVAAANAGEWGLMRDAVTKLQAAYDDTLAALQLPLPSATGSGAAASAVTPAASFLAASGLLAPGEPGEDPALLAAAAATQAAGRNADAAAAAVTGPRSNAARTVRADAVLAGGEALATTFVGALASGQAYRRDGSAAVPPTPGPASAAPAAGAALLPPAAMAAEGAARAKATSMLHSRRRVAATVARLAGWATRSLSRPGEATGDSGIETTGSATPHEPAPVGFFPNGGTLAPDLLAALQQLTLAHVQAQAAARKAAAATGAAAGGTAAQEGLGPLADALKRTMHIWVQGTARTTPPVAYYALACVGPAFAAGGAAGGAPGAAAATLENPEWHVLRAPAGLSGDAVLEGVRAAYPYATVLGPDTPLAFARPVEEVLPPLEGDAAAAAGAHPGITYPGADTPAVGACHPVGLLAFVGAGALAAEAARGVTPLVRTPQGYALRRTSAGAAGGTSGTAAAGTAPPQAPVNHVYVVRVTRVGAAAVPSHVWAAAGTLPYAGAEAESAAATPYGARGVSERVALTPAVRLSPDRAEATPDHVVEAHALALAQSVAPATLKAALRAAGPGADAGAVAASCAGLPAGAAALVFRGWVARATTLALPLVRADDDTAAPAPAAVGFFRPHAAGEDDASADVPPLAAPCAAPSEGLATTHTHAVASTGPCLSREKFDVRKHNPDDMVGTPAGSPVLRVDLVVAPSAVLEWPALAAAAAAAGTANPSSVLSANPWVTRLLPVASVSFTPVPLAQACVDWAADAEALLMGRLLWLYTVTVRGTDDPAHAAEAAARLPTRSASEDLMILLNPALELDDVAEPPLGPDPPAGAAAAAPAALPAPVDEAGGMLVPVPASAVLGLTQGGAVAADPAAAAYYAAEAALAGGADATEGAGAGADLEGGGGFPAVPDGLPPALPEGLDYGVFGAGAGEEAPLPVGIYPPPAPTQLVPLATSPDGFLQVGPDGGAPSHNVVPISREAAATLPFECVEGEVGPDGLPTLYALVPLEQAPAAPLIGPDGQPLDTGDALGDVLGLSSRPLGGEGAAADGAASVAAASVATSVGLRSVKSITSYAFAPVVGTSLRGAAALAAPQGGLPGAAAAAAAAAAASAAPQYIVGDDGNTYLLPAEAADPAAPPAPRPALAQRMQPLSKNEAVVLPLKAGTGADDASPDDNAVDETGNRLPSGPLPATAPLLLSSQLRGVAGLAAANAIDQAYDPEAATAELSAAGGDYTPRLDVAGLAVRAARFAAYGADLTPASEFPSAPPALLVPVPLEISPVVPSSFAARVVYAALEAALSPAWGFVAGFRPARTLLADYAEWKQLWREKTVTECRREWIRDQTARVAAGDAAAANEDVPDFASLLPREPAPVIVRLEAAFVSLLHTALEGLDSHSHLALLMPAARAQDGLTLADVFPLRGALSAGGLPRPQFRKAGQHGDGAAGASDAASVASGRSRRSRGGASAAHTTVTSFGSATRVRGRLLHALQTVEEEEEDAVYGPPRPGGAPVPLHAGHFQLLREAALLDAVNAVFIGIETGTLLARQSVAPLPK